ncbi:MAG: hypothetical protein IPM91_07315 [Bacteroidetes bacterium]|nr:hypothetical protein [Bacteroidota bacterium]
MDEEIRTGDPVKFVSSRFCISCGWKSEFLGEKSPRDVVKTNDVGYIISGIKNAKEVKVEIRLRILPDPQSPLLKVLKM